MKMLLYCTKAKPYLLHMPKDDEEFKKGIEFSLTSGKEFKEAGLDINDYKLNGKIVAECDFEVEKIFYGKTNENRFLYPEPYIPYDYHTNNLTETQLCYKSKLDINTLNEYLKEKNGYAIHIKNLNIFYTPKELSDYYSVIDMGGGMLGTKPLIKAPQNMMHISINHWEYCFYNPDDINILISIKPEWLCKILNGEKTIEVRKKVLRRML